MKQKQFAIVRNVAEKIVAMAQDEGQQRRYIQLLENAKSGNQFRSAIISMVKTHYKNGEVQPFIRRQDYETAFFPDGQGWDEVRDYLLICLYHDLHELRTNPQRISDDSFHELAETELGTIDIITL